MGSTINGIYIPTDGEAGWGSHVSANFTRQSENHVNVKAFGALANDVTNDASAIQAAVTALPSTGGTVFLPGTHFVSTGITDGGKPVRFLGVGPSASVIRGSGITILTLANNRSSVEKLTVLGSPSNASTIGIDVNNGAPGVVYWAIRDVEIAGTSNTGTGLRCIFGLEGLVHGGAITGWDKGVSLQRTGAGSSKSNANSFIACKIRVNTTGIDVPANGMDTGFVKDCTIEGNTTGINCAADANIFSISACHFENVTNELIASAGRILSSHNGFFGGVAANKDIVYTGAQSVVSSADLFNHGVTNNGSGVITVRDATLGVPSVTGTGVIVYVDGVSIKQLQPIGNNAYVIDGWAWTQTNAIKVANTGQLSFFGAALTSKPTITGSRGANAALADLLTKLATLGLITDSTTA